MCFQLLYFNSIKYSLSHPEGQGKVVASVLWVQFIEVKRVRVEVVDEGAEGHPIVPTCAEVLDLYSL